jgi:tetratricopeptide (TPR) repeat protein
MSKSMEREYVSVLDALKRRGNNLSGTWPERGEANRLEPDCWPTIQPRFKIPAGAKVFTIGSCFARNIENRSAAMGFQIPSVAATRNNYEFLDGGGLALDVYTPTAMLQELLWTKRILDRDDTPTGDDVLPLLLPVGRPDRFIDIHTRRDPGTGYSLEKQIQRRKIMYKINREAFFCDLAVITLGLIETWWDLESNQTIEFHPRMARHPQRDRFAFRRLNFEEAFRATERAISLLLEDPSRRILLTTSPVPIHQTFTEDDVIVANMFSKSVLRTVAGTIAEQHDRVDYFPSYEIVMLTKRAEVWTNDLIHVESAFVGQIMARVISHYVDDHQASAEYGEWVKFAELVQHAQFEEARPYYERLVGELNAATASTVYLTVAEYEMATGRIDDGRGHLSYAVENDENGALFNCLDYFRAARLYRALDEPGQVEPMFRKAAELCKNPVVMNAVISTVRSMHWEAEAGFLIKEAERLFPDDYTVLSTLAGHQHERGNMGEYHRLKQLAFAVGDEPPQLWAYTHELEKAGELDTAIELMLRSDERSTDPDIFRRLASLLMRQKQHELAEKIIDRRLDRVPGDASALGLKAIVCSARGRRAEALEVGIKALEAGTELVGVKRLVERLRRQPNLRKA